MESINIYSFQLVKEQSKPCKISKINHPKEAKDVVNLVLHINNSAVEKFGIITLNSKNHVAGVHVIAIGSINTVGIEPREVFQSAILNNSPSVIFFITTQVVIQKKVNKTYFLHIDLLRQVNY